MVYIISTEDNLVIKTSELTSFASYKFRILIPWARPISTARKQSIFCWT